LIAEAICFVAPGDTSRRRVFGFEPLYAAESLSTHSDH
jgi:hypothetical protein